MVYGPLGFPAKLVCARLYQVFLNSFFISYPSETKHSTIWILLGLSKYLPNWPKYSIRVAQLFEVKESKETELGKYLQAVYCWLWEYNHQ